jgi:fatty-acyl-CoA synthase
MLSTSMQDTPLQIRRILEHGSTTHATSQVVTAVAAGIAPATYATVGANAARLAAALAELGVGGGDRVATFMRNNQQHLEAYLAVPAMGAVIHPLGIGLPGRQLTDIANHAKDRMLIVDASLLPVLVPLLGAMSTVDHVVVNGSADASLLARMRVAVHTYPQLIAGRPDRYPWPSVDETAAAALCHVPGPAGRPTAVAYSHRAIYLHALGSALPDVFDLSAADRVLAVVPQAHLLAWGLPYSAFLTGASLALPDRWLRPAPLAEFIGAARPTKAAAPPAVWQRLLGYLDTHPDADISSLREGIVGDSACPPALIAAYRDRFGLPLLATRRTSEPSRLMEAVAE